MYILCRGCLIFFFKLGSFCLKREQNKTLENFAYKVPNNLYKLNTTEILTIKIKV